MAGIAPTMFNPLGIYLAGMGGKTANSSLISHRQNGESLFFFFITLKPRVE